ncbi:MAG: hypothetical protein WCO94_02770, partial [Verrucomicrobiota bacterium]
MKPKPVLSADKPSQPFRASQRRAAEESPKAKTISKESSPPPTTSEPSSGSPKTKVRRLVSDPVISARKHDIHGEDTGLVVDFSKDYATEC